MSAIYLSPHTVDDADTIAFENRCEQNGDKECLFALSLPVPTRNDRAAISLVPKAGL